MSIIKIPSALSSTSVYFHSDASTVLSERQNRLGTIHTGFTSWICVRCIQRDIQTVLPVTGGDSGNGGQHNSDNQLDEHEGCVHADLKYRRFTCNRVVTTVMMASTTVTSDHQLDEHEGYVYADLRYKRFTWNRVVTTVMMASTTVTTNWMSTEGMCMQI